MSPPAHSQFEYWVANLSLFEEGRFSEIGICEITSGVLEQVGLRYICRYTEHPFICEMLEALEQGFWA